MDLFKMSLPCNFSVQRLTIPYDAETPLKMRESSSGKAGVLARRISANAFRSALDSAEEAADEEEGARGEHARGTYTRAYRRGFLRARRARGQ